MTDNINFNFISKTVFTVPIKYVIISTDYDTYAIAYSCTDLLLGLINYQYSWILARQRNFDADNSVAVQNALNSYGIPKFPYVKVDQTNCAN